jgi:hypothetical protein
MYKQASKQARKQGTKGTWTCTSTEAGAQALLGMVQIPRINQPVQAGLNGDERQGPRFCTRIGASEALGTLSEAWRARPLVVGTASVYKNTGIDI